jgi:hypothetical protein
VKVVKTGKIVNVLLVMIVKIDKEFLTVLVNQDINMNMIMLLIKFADQKYNGKNLNLLNGNGNIMVNILLEIMKMIMMVPFLLIIIELVWFI